MKKSEIFDVLVKKVCEVCEVRYDMVLEEIGDISTMTKADIVNAIVGKVFEYSKKRV